MRNSPYTIHNQMNPKYWEQPFAATRPGVHREHRKADLSAANKIKGKAGGFLRSAAMKALNNLSKLVG